MSGRESSVRLSFLLLVLAALIVILAGFATWDLWQHRRAVAEVARLYGSLLSAALIGFVIFFPEVWLGPLVYWLERHAPRRLYYAAVYTLVALGILGVAFILYTAYILLIA